MTVKEFLQGTYFMNLGQSINHSSWQSAKMTLDKMRRTANEIGIHDFDHSFISLNMLILNKNKNEALDLMAMITAKRVALLKRLEEENKTESEKE